MYRKATACEHLGELNLAKDCLESALQVNANNLKAQDLLNSVNKRLQSKLGAALPDSAAGDPSEGTKGKGTKIQIEEVLGCPSEGALLGPAHLDVGEGRGSCEEGACDQPSAPPVDVLSRCEKLQTTPVEEFHAEQQQSSDSGHLESSDGDKLCPSDGDNVQTSVSDKHDSIVGDKRQPKDAEMQLSPPPDVSIMPSHLPSEVHVLKGEGNDLFQKGQYAEALEKYSQALQSMEKGKKALTHTHMYLCTPAP